MIRSLLIIFLILQTTLSLAQETQYPPIHTNQESEESIEQLTRKNESEYDYTDLIDEANQYLRNPLNLNNASEDQLRQLKLNDIQINNIQNYIEKFGEITSIYELNLIEGFDSTLIVVLQPYISFNLNTEAYKITLKNLLKPGNHLILTRYQRILQNQKGYNIISEENAQSATHSPYAGSPDKLLIKYNYNFHNRLRFGITMEKDAGESLSKGFDFYSYHLFYRSRGILKYIALGDYNLQLGQGLVMNSNFGFSKNSNNTIVTRQINQLKPITGSNENNGFKGGAVTLNPFKFAEITMFFSDKKVDATTNIIDTTSPSNYISTVNSLNETGLHRTIIELARKNAINRMTYGGNIQTRFKIVRLGFTAFTTQLSANLSSKEQPYNKFGFRGQSLTNFSSDIAIIYRSLISFIEIAGSDNGAKAYLAGISLKPDDLYGISLLYRNYAVNYHNFYSNAFSEGSANANERGFYLGLFAQLYPQLLFTAYADYYRFPWLKYRINNPSDGKEYMIQLKYKFSRSTEISFRYIYCHKIKTHPQSSIYNNFRFNMITYPHKSLILKSRIESITNTQPGHKSNSGFSIYQDIIFSPFNQPWIINCRYALFDTDTYEEKIYSYESDVLHSFSVSPYYYKGSRFYIMAKYSITSDIDIWIRFSQSYYNNKMAIGTGFEEIEGNKKSEIKMQLLLKL